MDVMLYSFALTAVRAEFHLTVGGGGRSGGRAAGDLGDRRHALRVARGPYGRARALIWSILTFSVFTGVHGDRAQRAELVFWRGIVGIGLGGEWAAGAVLVAETWPAKHRAKPSG